MSIEDHARAALAALDDRPVLARARILRFLGDDGAADLVFASAAERLEAAASSVTGTRRAELLVDAAGAWIEATEAGRGIAMLEEALPLSAPPAAARIAAWAAVAGAASLAERAAARAPEQALGSRLARAWRERDQDALGTCVDAMQVALDRPPLGPQEPWENSEAWTWLRWARRQLSY